MSVAFAELPSIQRGLTPDMPVLYRLVLCALYVSGRFGSSSSSAHLRMSSPIRLVNERDYPTGAVGRPTVIMRILCESPNESLDIAILRSVLEWRWFENK